MYIEVLHDAQGNIKACYCADTLPMNNGAPLFEVQGGTPAGLEQSRVNIDTLTAMEIEQASGQKAVIDPATGQPKIVNINRTEYIANTFRVNMAQTITPPAGTVLPPGINIRGLLRKV